MDISKDLIDEIERAKSQVDSLISQLSGYDELKQKVISTNESLLENLSTFSESMSTLEEGAKKLSDAAESIDKLSKILGALDIAKLNDRLSSIEENMTNLEKSIKKKVNKLEENLELKIKNSSLFSKVFNK